MQLPTPLQQIDRTYVRYEGRKFSYFAGCDYFRLASHPKVLRAAETGLKKFGLNVAASRLTTGNHDIFGKLESALAEFFDAESALLVSNGYVTNLVVAQALAGRFSHVVMDEKAHPSLKDAAQILGGRTINFRHLDPADLKRVVSKLPKTAGVILLTDGMFSHNGSIAPLRQYMKVLPSNAMLLLDDAHGAGTLGNSGKGTIELENVPRKRVIQSITLSKAFGCYGGAILCDAGLRQAIISKSRLFVGSTPLPLPLAGAAFTAVQTLAKEKALRQRLNDNVSFVKERLRESGFEMADSPSPILAIAPKSSREVDEIRAACLRHKVFPSFIKYPGGPENGFFRFVLSSEHSRAQLEALMASVTRSF